jgi:photoactive yellow protein
VSKPEFSTPELFDALEACDDGALDGLDFGVVGMALSGVTDRYNAYESGRAGLSASRVLGKHFFTEVAPCTNNFMVAQRFEESALLDETIPYVFTLRMRPRKVELRLLKREGVARQYLVVRERPATSPVSPASDPR